MVSLFLVGCVISVEKRFLESKERKKMSDQLVVKMLLLEVHLVYFVLTTLQHTT